jgi:hypothetical protein
LSALKFVPWMLTAFIQSVIPAYFFFCYLTKRTNTLPWQLEMIFQPLYWIADLTYSTGTYWHWVIVWILTLTPQVLVLAAVIRVRRLNNERKRSLLTEPEVGALKNIETPTTTSPQHVPSRSQYVCLPHSVDIPETSHLSQNDLEDLPSSYSALEPSYSTLPPSYSTQDVLQES